MRGAAAGFVIGVGCLLAGTSQAQSGAVDPTMLGEEGESCRARADCAQGLKCIDNVCVDAFKGATCEATSECGGKLRCVGNVCVEPEAPSPKPPSPKPPAPQPVAPQPVAPQPAAPAPEPPPAAATVTVLAPSEADADAPPPSGRWIDFALSGFHPFAGFVVAPGASIYIDHNTGNVSTSNPSMLFAFRGGLLFSGTTELALEIAPFTYAPFLSSDPVFQANVSIGSLLHVAGPVYWPFRFGAGVVAANLPGPAAQMRLDLLGVAFNVGHVLVDLYLPSVRVFTDFDVYTVASFNFGLGASYVF